MRPQRTGQLSIAATGWHLTTLELTSNNFHVFTKVKYGSSTARALPALDGSRAPGEASRANQLDIDQGVYSYKLDESTADDLEHGERSRLKPELSYDCAL